MRQGFDVLNVLHQQPRDDSSDGADREGCVVVTLEDGGDFFLFLCWFFLPDCEDQFSFGLSPLWLVGLLWCSGGMHLSLL